MIKAARKKKKYTQSFLAKKTGISQGYISKLENTNIHSPTIKEILIISKALNLCPIHLAYWFMQKNESEFKCPISALYNFCNECSLHE